MGIDAALSGFFVTRNSKKGTEMKCRSIVLASAILAGLCGCSTMRSISDSGYQQENRYAARSSNPFYKGELSEFDVLGIDLSAQASDATIQSELKEARRVALRKGDSVLLVQSGALMPDEPMVRALERYFSVSIFSGVPPESVKDSAPRFSSALRLAAARAGCSKILAYWGTLESGHRNLATKSVSWVPIIGNVIPDQTQQMRIRLKVAVVDVATGQWVTYSPAGFDDAATSASWGRESSDQGQVAGLKEKSYTAAVEDLLKRYVR